MAYISYNIIFTSPCCNKKIIVDSCDYYSNAKHKQKQLIEIFGSDRVEIQKVIRK